MTSQAIASHRDIGERPRWQTFLFDVVGFAAVIWAIPLTIIVIGAPIGLVVMMVRAVMARL